ncbi:diacylglycerol kinase family lipid kinase [Aquibacillus koreensis]|uniref:Diacylglycerol kinase family lipid kinase n=1 Tax=Aquibacillus koreensis TaxID=279446 RepID=A0A9X3WKU9_9BACI|nr:diacylglycerol kinase family protein [Aquibacillus koreensis]MCT2537290.1 diacylglycerol kinase family lipid kinase [Aquibacillus koreensis]MDC3421637.1 diacylglycerol kinase family lipid kinase [Aquibacillus koreensis]
MERVAVIFNPTAGRGKLQKQKVKIEEILHNQFEQVDFYETQKYGDSGDLVRKVASEVDIIIAAGGDGTVNEVVNALCRLDRRPVLGIIPGGTSNDFSRAIGMYQNPVKATYQIVDKHQQPVDVGKTDKNYFLNFWGIGLITQVASNVDSEVKDRYGRFGYYLRTAQTMGKTEPFHLQLEADDFNFDDEAVMLVVGNGTFTAGVEAFFPKGDVQDGLLDVLLIKETSVQVFWSMLQTKMSNQPTKEEGYIYFQTKKLKVTATPEQTVDCDGERRCSTPSEIEVLPDYLTMLVGEMK